MYSWVFLVMGEAKVASLVFQTGGIYVIESMKCQSTEISFSQNMHSTIHPFTSLSVRGSYMYVVKHEFVLRVLTSLQDFYMYKCIITCTIHIVRHGPYSCYLG